MRIMKSPRSVEISITSHCNLTCLYCSHFTSNGDVGKDLPKEEWIDFFRELGQLSVMSVTLEGGEPFIRPDLKEIIQGIVDNRMRFSILSNGTLITEDMAIFLKETGRCDYVQVSIDGASANSHDTCRGKGSFTKALKGLRILRKYGIPIAVRVTIHKLNMKDLENVARLLLEEEGLPSFSTNSASYLGMCRQNIEYIGLSAKDRSKVMKTLLQLADKYNGRISAMAGPLAEARTWIAMEKARKNRSEGLPGRGYLTGCGGIFEKVGVRADGVIVPCIQLSHIELGKINQDDLKEIWKNHPELISLRKRREIPLTKFEFCKECEYINYCTGNCPALAYTITGMENHPSPDACLRKFLREGGVLPDNI